MARGHWVVGLSTEDVDREKEAEVKKVRAAKKKSQKSDSNPNCLSLSRARGRMMRSRPWKIYLEFVGPNDNVQSGWSEKFWEASGRGFGASVTVRYGKIGTEGTRITKDWPYVERKVEAKIREGYRVTENRFNKRVGG